MKNVNIKPHVKYIQYIRYMSNTSKDNCPLLPFANPSCQHNSMLPTTTHSHSRRHLTNFSSHLSLTQHPRIVKIISNLKTMTVTCQTLISHTVRHIIIVECICVPSINTGIYDERERKPMKPDGKRC
jgi:hypothetical protein